MSSSTSVRRMASLGACALPAGLVMIFLSASIVCLLQVVFKNGLHGVLAILHRPDYVEVVVRTQVISVAVVAICVLLGYPLAAYIASTTLPRNRLLLFVVLPWLVSIVVRCLGWVTLLGPAGLINSSLSLLGVKRVSLMFNNVGVIIASVHVLMPFVVLSILGALLQIPKSLFEASNSLGSDRFATFVRVTLPLTSPGLISGAMIVYLSCCGSVIAPLMLGGLGQNMVGTQIYTDIFTFFDFEKAGSLALILVASSLIVILPMLILERNITRRISVGKET
ncbi:ABC transporter permease [Caballeronia sp. dw_19]|uniref:ABC transporter permease n=1 Tax=Caballeronia sp. dw_19 TaxID=2719791 RepID=UPI001BCE62BC|nr:ABC transporter permease [Caballeronia sp. dw_19]